MNNTKAKILEASLELFSKSGFSATSIRQIAREVGVRESAVYNHFKSVQSKKYTKIIMMEIFKEAY